MGNIEGEAATAVRELVQSRERVVPPYARHALAWLLALQWQRSRFLMHVVAKEIGAEDSGLSDEEIQTSMMGLIPMTVIEPWLLRNDEDAYYKDRWNHLVSTLLASDMHWSCYRPRSGGLLVSDNPVCLSGVVGTPPPEMPAAFFDHGVRTGFHNFRRLTLPLGSRLGVVISRDSQDASRSPKPVGQPTRLRGFPKTFGLAGGLVTAAQTPSYVEEYGAGRGAWEMFKDIVDPFGFHEAVEAPAAGGSVCPPTNCA